MTTRKQIFQFIETKYNVKPEKTFSKFPNYCVFRHRDNNKWFGLIMNVPKNKIGLNGTEEIDIIDIKVEPELIGSLINKEGYFPAYHMNKEHWVSINLSSDIPFEEIQQMIDHSFELTL